jgi:hypothetical protein
MRRLSRCDDPVDVRRSPEYGSTIIHSVVTGRASVVYGNMPNRGAIANLPADAIAEAPTTVDRSGLRFSTVGELPPQLLAYMQPHVAQHELFIRAATEGRRDHVYQACMFDPLTATTLAPDKIVEMCDELIAAHGFAKDGGVLPDLDAKRTLVPTSGKTFPRADTAQLRNSWTKHREQSHGKPLKDWHVVGPFRGGPQGRVSLDTPTPLAEDAHPNVSALIVLNGTTWRWQRANSDSRGFIDLTRLLGPSEWSVAYGYAEFHSDTARETILTCGSDDGIRIWLNGEIIHAREVGRAYRPADDEVAARLCAGINRILVKIDNYQGGWGFGVAIR